MSKEIFFCKDCKELSSDSEKCLNNFHITSKIPNEILEQYELEQKSLGAGEIGFVLKGFQKSTKKNYALKFIFLHNQEKFDELANEIKIMVNIKAECDFLIKYHTCFVFSTVRCAVIVMELADSNIFQKLKIFSFDENLKILLQICEGLKHLHKKIKPRIIHRNFYPENILLSENNVKISDFGLAKSHIDKKDYMAPEILEENNKINNKVDIWALGIIIHMMFSQGVHPFGKKAEKRIANIKKCKFKLSTNIKDEEIIQIIKGCFVKDPAKRLSIKKILEILHEKNNKKIKKNEEEEKVMEYKGSPYTITDDERSRGNQSPNGKNGELKVILHENFLFYFIFYTLGE